MYFFKSEGKTQDEKHRYGNTVGRLSVGSAVFVRKQEHVLSNLKELCRAGAVLSLMGKDYLSS